MEPMEQDGTMEPQAVLVSLLGLISAANALVTKQFPRAVCVRASGIGKLVVIPQTYEFLFREEGRFEMVRVEVTQDFKTGALTWSPLTQTRGIVGVTGDLLRCTVDIYSAYKAIRQAGFQSPVSFCSLFQAEALDIKEPWYCYTPTDCHWISSEKYIFVNALTGVVRLFPSDGSSAGLGTEAQAEA